MMYILFKMHVQGDTISEFEYKDIVKHLEKHNYLMSNAAKKVFSGPDFLDY